MDCLSSHEKKALQAASIGMPWEYRARLGGAKTFTKLLERGWIEPFSGHNPNGDRYSITEAGMEARNLPSCPGRQKGSRLNTLPPLISEAKGRFGV
jgi:hypothetical protein